MPKQKKVVPYVPDTKLPDRRDAGDIMWAARNKYSYNDLFNMLDKVQKFWNEDKRSSYYGREDARKYYEDKFSNYGVTADNWNIPLEDGNARAYVLRFLHTLWPVSEEFKRVNDLFMAEYNSRTDLQELYVNEAKDINWHYDCYGNHHARGQYYQEQGEKSRDFWTAFNLAPPDFTSYAEVTNTNSARKFIEMNRPTPFEPGDLVKLRTPYIGHPDHDPLWISRYEQAKNGTTIPDKSVHRIGLLLKVTNDVPWRGSRGSKRLEVLWQGTESSVYVPEKIVKWEERPTLKNGLKK